MKTIAFSLLCHEAPECVLDLMRNVRRHTTRFDCWFLVSCTKSVEKAIREFADDRVVICNVRDDEMPMWGNLNLFWQHVLNFRTASDKGILSDYFWFLSSNEYFIKEVVDPPAIRKVARKTKMDDDAYQAYFRKFYYSSQVWFLEHMKADEYAIDYFKRNRLEFHDLRLEGTVLDKETCDEVMTEYARSGIHENSILRDYVMEEVFFISYLRSNYVLENDEPHCIDKRWYGNDDPACMTNGNRYKGLYWHMDDRSFYEKMTEMAAAISIKPVARAYDDAFRTFLRTTLNAGKKIEWA